MPETIKIDQHIRQLSISWCDFELLLETLHNYVNEALTKLPKKEVTELANSLTSQWHSLDEEKPERKN